SWGIGTLRPATTVGAAGQTAIVSTRQLGDIANPNLPGTLPDTFWQEPIDIIPVPPTSTHVAYLNGTLIVSDTSSASDAVQIASVGRGSVRVTSNLGSNTYSPVNSIFVALGSGNNNVQIGNLPGVTVNVTALDGNNTINVGATRKLAIQVGAGNNI